MKDRNGGKQEPVAVVGGGLAGIAAAVELTTRGVPVHLFESKNRLGGRAGSFTQTDSENREEVVDYCQHVGMGCCHDLQRLIKTLGQQNDWQRHEALHFYGPDGSYRRLAALPGLPAPMHLAGWLWAWPGLTISDRLAVVWGMLRVRRLTLNERLDDISALDWLQQNRQTRGSIDRFWSTIIVSALGEELRNVSLAAVCKVLQDGFLNSRDAFHLLVPRKPLSQLFDLEAQQVLEKLGVQIFRGNRVQRICERDTGIAIATSQSTREYSAAILAVPWHQIGSIQVLRRSGQELAFPTARRLASSPISGVHTWWDRPWLDKPHAAIVGRLCQWVFPKPSSTHVAHGTEDTFDTHQTEETHPGDGSNAPAAGEHYYQIVISASRELPQSKSSEVGTLIQCDLAAVFPEVRDAVLTRFRVVTDPNSVFSVAPGTAALRPEKQTEVDRLLLAGDWTNTGWPATMEGAVRSGFDAAREILAKFAPSQLAKLEATKAASGVNSHLDRV